MGYAEAAMKGVQILGNQAGAVMSYQASQDQAKQMINESEDQASQSAESSRKFAANQESAYLKSGVTLEGSPLLVLEETRRKGLAAQNNIRESARAQANALVNNSRNQLYGSFLFAGSQMGQLGAQLNSQYGAPSSQPATMGDQINGAQGYSVSDAPDAYSVA